MTTDDSSDPERDVGEHTKRITTAGARGDVSALAEEVAMLRRAAARESGSRNVWRGLGGLAASAALGLATWALTLGQDAAVNASIVARHDEEIREMVTKLDDQRGTLAEVQRDAAVQSATQTQLRQAVTDLTTEVRGLRDDLARRGGR